MGWHDATGLFPSLAGRIALVQVLAWKPAAVGRVPLLWILYVGYAALGAGLLVAAAHATGAILRAAWPAHVIGVAGLSVLIIGWSGARRWDTWGGHYAPIASSCAAIGW